MNIRDLSIGLAALQLGKADAARLAEAYRAYVAQSGGDWAAHSTGAGVLSADDAREVAAFVEQLVCACGNDERAALNVLGGLEKAREVFQGAIADCLQPTAYSLQPPWHFERGATLRQLIDRSHALAERSALLPLFAEACRIVAAAHARGTVHRNLHPGTIFVGHSHAVAVADWSAGRVRGKHDAMGDALAEAVQRLRDDRPSDDALAVALEPAYLAPELALGHIEEIDARADVYALGAILYTLLTGKPPFAAERTSEVLHAVGTRKPESVSSAQPAAPPELAAICERAMHQEPSARYASAKQLADELAQAFHAPAARPRERAVQPAWPYALLGACAMGLVTLVVAFMYAGAANKASDAFRSLAALEQKCSRTEEERDRLARDLDETQRLRQQMETEREQADVARAQLQASVKRSEDAQRKAETELAKTKGQEPAPAPRTGEAQPAEPAEEEPSVSEPSQSAKEAPAAAQRPPGLTKAEYAKDLPELIAALKAEPAADGKVSVVVRPEGADVAGDMLRLQFKDGDIITNINRSAIESLEQAQRILETLKNDPGFNVRILRNGQPSVMRVNVVDAAPPPKPAAEPRSTTKGGLTLITPKETRPLAPDEAEPQAETSEEPADEKES